MFKFLLWSNHLSHCPYFCFTRVSPPRSLGQTESLILTQKWNLTNLNTLRNFKSHFTPTFFFSLLTIKSYRRKFVDKQNYSSLSNPRLVVSSKRARARVEVLAREEFIPRDSSTSLGGWEGVEIKAEEKEKEEEETLEDPVARRESNNGTVVT